MFGRWDILPSGFLFVMCLWIPVAGVLWMHMGFSHAFFFYSIWSFLFGLMVMEDLICQTVDLRLAAVLFALTGFYRLACVENGVSEFGWGCAIGLYISLLVFVLGIRVDDEQPESEGMRKLTTMQIGFVPSVGIAIVLWLAAADFIVGWNDAMYVAENLFFYDMAAGIVAFTLVMGSACCYQYWRIRRVCGKERKALTVGFGEGDILICLIVGGFLGWKSFLFVFMAALCVHVAVAAALFAIGSMRAGRSGAA